MKKTINALLIGLFLLLISIDTVEANLGEDRYKHYEKARIINCHYLYFENNYRFREATPMHGIMCEDIFHRIRDIQFRNLQNYITNGDY